MIAVFDEDLTDDAAGWMLDFLDVAGDDDSAGCKNSAREIGRSGPAAHAAYQKNERGKAKCHIVFDRRQLVIQADWCFRQFGALRGRDEVLAHADSFACIGSCCS